MKTPIPPMKEYAEDPAFADYLITDEFAETVKALEHMLQLLELAKNDTYIWKWILLCAHSAVQNACVCILSGTAGTGALTDKSAKRLLERFEKDWHGDEPWPRERLAEFPTLLRRVSEKTSIRIPESPDWDSFDQGTDLVRLHNHRNDFMHFRPMSWLIELDGLPRIARHAVDAVHEITQSEDYRSYNRFHEFDLRELFAMLYFELNEAQRRLRYTEPDG